jgi:Fe-Mn family superoxide dismutase
MNLLSGENMNRREVLTSIVGSGLILTQVVQAAQTPVTRLRLGVYPFVLPDLGFALEALMPRMSAETLEIHHKTLHNGYVSNLNRVLSGVPSLQKLDLVELVSQVQMIPEALRTEVRWFAGGEINHRLFWRWLTPGGKMSERLKAFLSQASSLEKLREDFITRGMGIRGSGWVWLVLEGGKLSVSTTTQQDNPLMFGQKPLLGCDVFEHSYFLDYKAGRRAYLQAFWDHLVNWSFVELMLDS